MLRQGWKLRGRTINRKKRGILGSMGDFFLLRTDVDRCNGEVVFDSF